MNQGFMIRCLMLVEVCVAERPGPKLSFDWWIETYCFIIVLLSFFTSVVVGGDLFDIVFPYFQTINSMSQPCQAPMPLSAWPRGCVTTLAVLGTPNATETSLTQLNLQRGGGWSKVKKGWSTLKDLRSVSRIYKCVVIHCLHNILYTHVLQVYIYIYWIIYILHYLHVVNRHIYFFRCN